MVPLQAIVGFIAWGYGTKNQIYVFQRRNYWLLHVKCWFKKLVWSNCTHKVPFQLQNQTHLNKNNHRNGWHIEIIKCHKNTSHCLWIENLLCSATKGRKNSNPWWHSGRDFHFKFLSTFFLFHYLKKNLLHFYHKKNLIRFFMLLLQIYYFKKSLVFNNGFMQIMMKIWQNVYLSVWILRAYSRLGCPKGVFSIKGFHNPTSKF